MSSPIGRDDQAPHSLAKRTPTSPLVTATPTTALARRYDVLPPPVVVDITIMSMRRRRSPVVRVLLACCVGIAGCIATLGLLLVLGQTQLIAWIIVGTVLCVVFGTPLLCALGLIVLCVCARRRAYRPRR